MHRRFALFFFFLFLVLSTTAQTDLTFSSINSTNGLSDNRIRNLVQLKDGRMIVTTEGGTTNLFNGTSFRILHQKGKVSSALPGYTGYLHGYADKDYFWVKNLGTLKVVDIRKEAFIDKPDSVLKAMGIAEPAADFFMDVKGGYWIRTVSDKLLYRPVGAEIPIQFCLSVSKPFKHPEVLLDLAVVGGELYLVYRSGLMVCYQLQSRRMLYRTRSLNPTQQKLYHFTLMIAQSGNELYMVRNGDASIMQRFDTKNRRWETLLQESYWLSTVSVDIDRNIWVSCATGLWRFDRKTGKKQFYASFKLVDGTDVTTEANTLYNDSQGGLWLGTYSHGLLYYHPDRFKFNYYGKSLFQAGSRDFEVNGFVSLVAERVLVSTSMGWYEFNPKTGALKRSAAPGVVVSAEKNKALNGYVDRRGFTWSGTLDGLNIRFSKSNIVRTLYTEDGLVNNSIKGILEDSKGNMWISTANGISKIAVRGSSFDITNFNQYDGVIKNEFIANALCETKEGLLFIGGVNEFNVLDLNKPWLFRKLDKPLLTDFSLFGTSIQPGETYQGKVLLRQALASTNKIVLNHRQHSIGIRFSALNYVNPTQTYYQYRLKGIDEQWHAVYEPNGIGSASYSNLPPGTYVFEVKAANNSHVWSREVTRLILEVKPPFWKTIWAYLIYGVLVLMAAYFTLMAVRKQTQRRLAKRNEEHLNELKFKFFTNISHEFRTPLTLIITPLEALLGEVKGLPLEQKLRSVYKHAEDLLHLVNQLLDFRRLELGGEKLRLAYGNLSDFLQQFDVKFEKLAQLRQIDFSVETPESDIYLYFDHEKLGKVLNNLLSNAFKFTPAGGEVRVVCFLKEERVVVEVVDSGVGISKIELAQVFNRYFQGSNAQEGSGIGLHLVKEYVELHQGSVSVESELGAGTVFRLELPMTLGPVSVEKKETVDRRVDGVEKLMPKTTHTILVVEDNDDLRTFLVAELGKTYRVLEAPNGVEAEKLVVTELPDLVVSDVMMPLMDGLELCRRIKSDLRTSHIPVVLLTAKVSEEHKLNGFQAGADEYLPKPFRLEMLLLRVQQLMEQQEKRKGVFSGKIVVNPAEITISSLDEQLLQKALDCVERNMGNPDYSVQQLSQELSMDRSVLYKKLQSLTGLPPSEFIRSLRLKRAAQLLLQGGLPVVEVAEMVGFNTPKYFTKYFKEAFGVTPSHYAQQVVKA